MLSIHKLEGAGRADADRCADYPREDGRDSAEDVEDYYSATDGGAPSRWLGAGAAALGLAGAVQREDQIAVMMGEDPRTGEVLGQKRQEGKRRRFGEDLTFSAPKSVSIAWVAGTPDVRAAIERAQDAAVARTLAHIEKRLTLAQRGKGGAERETAKLVAAAYRHGSSREQDPQLHTHCVVANLAQRHDGGWGGIENSQLLRNKMALGALYRAELAHAMRELGFAIEHDDDSFKLGAISAEVCDEFSRRRDQIEKAMRERGTSGGRAAEIAALATRRGKELTNADVLRADWLERAAAHGVTADALEAARFQADAEQPVYDRAAVLTALTRGESTFNESAVWREVAIAAQGSGMGIDAIEREVAELLQDKELVRLRPREDLQDLTAAGRKRPKFQQQQQRMTTRAMLQLERDMASLAESAQGSTVHAVSAAAVDRAIADFADQAGFALSEEQQAAVRHICEAAGDVQLVRGAAGAGKTTLAEAARMTWQSQGLRVRGAAISGKAARGLQDGAGIESQTIASLLLACQASPEGDPPRDPLTSDTVLMVDEAGMIGSRKMRELLQLCKEAGAKLVVIGDEKQLQSVEAGGAFRALQQRVGTAEMVQNQRQRLAHKDMAQAVEHAERGEAGQALALLAEHDLVQMQADRDTALRATVEKWSQRVRASGKPQECLMLTGTRASAAALNQAALEHQKAAGTLGPGATITTRDRNGKSLGQRELCEGGRVLFKKNDKSLGVMNGELGTVERVDVDPQGRPTIAVRLDRGEVVTIQPEHAHNGPGKAPPGVGYANLEHGYAVTTHAAQGATVDHAIVFADGTMANREQTYVQVSRMRYTTDMIFNVADLEADEDQLVDVPPTESMVEFAKSIAERRGNSLTDEDLESFAACRDWLNTHGPNRIDEAAGDKDVLAGELERLKDLAQAMSRSAQKDTTHDYEVGDEDELTTQPEHTTLTQQQAAETKTEAETEMEQDDEFEM
ncbi:MobF family relaxase [Thiomonas intermedia]|uniref:MobF family relaxase n=1 Tax=Thiomonas intermedia TaxID=926 RepID=UPI0014756EE7|nr:MobF family relaxase [Thiomonas intermedia]